MMVDLRRAFEKLLVASRKAAQALEETYERAVGESNAKKYVYGPLEDFREEIEEAAQALRDHDRSA